MIAGQLDLLDALAEPEPKPAPAPRRAADDMTRCRRCQRPADLIGIRARNLLACGAPTPAVQRLIGLHHATPLCRPCAPDHLDRWARAGGGCRRLLETYTHPATTETR